MAYIQAYKRTIPYTHTFPDVTLKFLPNELGHVVCDVESQSAIDRLLQTPTGFRMYGEQSDATLLSPVLAQFVAQATHGAIGSEEDDTDPVKAPETPAPSDPVATLPPEGQSEPAGETAEKPADEPESPFVLRSGDDVLDLRTLDDGALRAFAEANKISVHHNAKGDTIRTKIVEALRAE